MPIDDNVKSDSWLTHQWVVAGIVSASARFIPIPFLDDIVREQSRKYVVSRTLAASDRSTSLADLKSYYSTDGGCVVGCLGMLVRLPLKLLLFPVRKVITIVTSVHGVPMEIIRTILLGRTLDRQLKLREISADDAANMKLAFEQAFARMDFRAVRAAVKDAIRSVHGWKAAAIKSARQLAESRESRDPEIATDASVETSATNIQEVLQRPETARLFAEFDARFDESFSPAIKTMAKNSAAQ